MPRDCRTLYQYVYTITDVIGLLFVLLLSPIIFAGKSLLTAEYQLFIFWSITSWFLLTAVTRYYYHTRDGASFAKRFRQTLKLSMLYALATRLFNSWAPYTIDMMIGVGFLLFGTLLFFRVIVNAAMHHLLVTSGVSQQVLIIGDGENGEYVKNHITYSAKKGRKIAGFVNEEGRGDAVLGNLDDIEELVRKHQIEEIIFTMPIREVSNLQKLQDFCSAQGVRLHWIPMVSRRAAEELGLEYFGDIPLVTLYQTPLDTLYARFRKRLFDVVGALLLLLIFSPVILLTAVAVKCTSRGPLFYKQKRIGILGSEFFYYKFRTMKVDVDAPVTASFAGEHLTLIGLFLKKSNLDELPQLFNILRGDMSFVGPRPKEVATSSNLLEAGGVLFTHQLLKPGIVGAAQLNTWRVSTTTEESERMRMEHDMLYVKQWSLSRDVKIAFNCVFPKTTQHRVFKMRF